MIDYLELLEENINPEDIDVSSITLHSELNPVIWSKNNGNYILKDSVKSKLKTIVDKFSDFIRYKGSKISLTDVVLTGSNCNFNYTPTSDLDVHLLVDYSSVPGDGELISEYLFDKKVLWGLKYDAKYGNISIECYAGDSEDEFIEGAAYYSLMKDEWLVKPDRRNIVIDLNAVKDKTAELLAMIERVETVEQIDKLKDKLRRMRYTGLHSTGEFSVETLAYKLLRNNGAIDSLNKRRDEMKAL